MFLGPVHSLVVAGLALLGGFLAGPMDPAADQPRYLDSGQFAALVVAAGLVVALLAIIAVGTWRR
jgi:hypothetical protein